MGEDQDEQYQDTCYICIEILEGEMETLDCTHRYHHACIAEWMKQNPVCPECRAYIYQASNKVSNFSEKIVIFNALLTFNTKVYGLKTSIIFPPTPTHSPLCQVLFKITKLKFGCLQVKNRIKNNGSKYCKQYEIGPIEVNIQNILIENIW